MENKMTQSFDEYCKKNQHSGNCTRLEAFSMGQRSRQAEIDELQKRIDDALKHVVDHGGYDDLTHVINILKGKEND